MNGNGTYDVIHGTNEDRIEKYVSEEDLRAPEGAISYGDLVTLVKVVPSRCLRAATRLTRLSAAKELRGQVQTSSLDEPVDHRKFPGENRSFIHELGP